MLADLRRAWASALYWLREFTGENDYMRYVAEWRLRHPSLAAGDEPGAGARNRGHRLLSEREFYALRLEQRYGRATLRC